VERGQATGGWLEHITGFASKTAELSVVRDFRTEGGLR